MKVAVIGSRSLTVRNLEDYLPVDTDEIVSGGAKGIDTVARNYAIEHGIKLKEFLPDYQRYKMGAPLKRNLEIIKYADLVIAFWDGKSKGTKHVIEKCIEKNKELQVNLIGIYEPFGGFNL